VYEPEEYQQYQAEARFQVAFRTKADRLPLFTWWVFRDFNVQIHYKKTNTKGLFTLGNGKRDIYYLYRSFLRPDDPIVHIASKRYFVREGSATNGIKVYSNRPELTLTVNGRSWGAQRNGQYRSAGHVVENVFFWTQPLHQGSNHMVVSDGQGHEDRTVLVFAGQGGRPPSREEKAVIRDLTSSNPRNPAYYIDQPVQPQWSFYYDDASNELDQVPAALTGASWIATRRLSDPANRTEIRFTVVRDADVYVMAAGAGSMPAFLAQAGFTDAGIGGEWRDDLRTLVPYRLYRKRVAGGEAVTLGEASIDYLVLVNTLR
jgi:beta-galactosidase